MFWRFSLRTLSLSDINKLKSLVMSKESPFEIIYILTGFFSLEILQEPEVLGNRSAEIVRFAIPSKFLTININLHF